MPVSAISSLDFRQKEVGFSKRAKNIKEGAAKGTITSLLAVGTIDDNNMSEGNEADEAAGPSLLEREFQLLNVAAVRRRQVIRRRCSKEGCRNLAQKGGVCMKHGAKAKRCSSVGCTIYAREGGVCIKHGAKVQHKRCSTDGCTNYAHKGGVCIRHRGAYRRRRNH